MYTENITRDTHKIRPQPWRWALTFIFAPVKLSHAYTRWQLREYAVTILTDRIVYRQGGRDEAYASFLAGKDGREGDRRRRVKEWRRIGQVRMLRDFWGSFMLAVMLVLASTAAAVLHGSVRPSLPPDWGKVMQIVGGALAAWGTFFALGHVPATFGGRTVLEQIRPRLFILLAGPGAFLAAVGTLW